MIEVNNLGKDFDAFTAVSELSFSAVQGEVVGFLGPNGAGKSTAMKMITGFLAPSRGDVIICGQSVAKNPLFTKTQIGYLPEGAPAYGEMTPMSYLDFIADMRGLTGTTKQRSIEEVIEKIHLDEVLYRPIDNLSKGYKRRVGLAQAILHNPPILILDEPTDGLDPNQKHEVRELILNMASDKAIVISTHILEEVEALCTRAIIIAAGTLLFDGTPAEFEARSKHKNNVVLELSETLKPTMPEAQNTAEGQAAAIKALPQVQGVAYQTVDNLTQFSIAAQGNQAILQAVAELCHAQQWPVRSLRTEPVQLDEVFRMITTQSVQQGGLRT